MTAGCIFWFSNVWRWGVIGLLGSGIVIRQGGAILHSVGDLSMESMPSGSRVKSDISPHDSTGRCLTCSMTGIKHCGMVANIEVETLHLLDWGLVFPRVTASQSKSVTCRINNRMWCHQTWWWNPPICRTIITGWTLEADRYSLSATNVNPSIILWRVLLPN